MRAFAKAALLLLVLSLPFAKPGVTLGGLRMVATDVVYLIVVIALAIAIARREARLHWNNGVAILAFYFAAMVVSVLVAGALAAAAPKLASQIYLLSLPLLVDALIDDLDDLKRVFRAWLAGTAICVAVGVATLVLFVVGVDRAAIDFALHGFGTLPPGAYPRLEATFTYPAMLCNYLTVSLIILLLCLHLRWIGRIVGYTLLAAILTTAAFTLTPGLGGIAAAFGAALFVAFRVTNRALAIAGLAVGSALAIAFVAVAVVTPILHPTAPFLVHLPGIDAPLAPSVRLMAWIEAGKSFLANPLFGSGLGSDPIAVDYVAPSGDHYVLTDAHNVYLNIAMHGGLVGLAAILGLIGFVARKSRLWPLTDANLIPVALGFVWLNAFAYQGLTGSYEDARHLWLLLGLLFAALRLQPHVLGTRGP